MRERREHPVKNNSDAHFLEGSSAYDLVVVGNDPAGFYCGWAGAQAGLKVLHLTSKMPVALCPEWAPTLTSEQMFAPLNFHEWENIPNLVIQSTKNVEYHRDLYLPKKFDLPGQVYNREVFERHLLIQAQNAGVTIATDVFFQGFSDGGIEVEAQRKKFKIKVKCVAAADGVRSAVRTALKLEAMEYVAILQYRVELRVPHETAHFFHGGNPDDGLGWFIPRQNTANVGFGISRHVAQVLIYKLHQLLDFLIEQEWIEADDVYQKTGGLIPRQGTTVPPGIDGVFLLGDAGGFRDTIFPELGIGLGSSCVGGILAGQLIAEEIKAKRTPSVGRYLEIIQPVLEGRFKLKNSSGLKKLNQFLTSPRP